MNQRTLKGRYQNLNIPTKSLPETILKSPNISTTSEQFNGSSNFTRIIKNLIKNEEYLKCQNFIHDFIRCTIQHKSKKKIALNIEEMLFWLQQYFIITNNQAITLTKIYNTKINDKQSLISVLYDLFEFLNQDEYKEQYINICHDIQSLLLE